MNINELKESKYLRKEDVGEGKAVTIKRFSKMNVALESEEPQEKWVMFIDESPKGLVMNMTNAETIAEILGSKETNDWIGQKIVLYNDRSVMYAGKRTGGIRARAVKKGVEPKKGYEDTETEASRLATQEEFNDDIPF